MTPEPARRIQSRGDSAPDSRTGRTGFGRRAQSAADRRQGKVRTSRTVANVTPRAHDDL